MLNKMQLAREIEALMASAEAMATTSTPMSRGEYAEDLATIIDNYVRSGTVSVDTFAAVASGVAVPNVPNTFPVSGSATGKVV